MAFSRNYYVDYETHFEWVDGDKWPDFHHGLSWPQAHFRDASAPWRRWVVVVPIWIPLSLAAFPTALLWRRKRGPLPGRCRCGYDLTGNVSGVCPECGTGCKRARV